MKRMTYTDESSKTDLDVQNKALASGLLSDHKGFVISPNISEYALTDEEQTYGDSLIKDYLEIKFEDKKLAKGDNNGRLIQAREMIITLNRQIVIALLNGEPETSDYIQVKSDRIIGLIAQAKQLEILVGQKTKSAA